jgi:hypothetical protein
MKAKSELVREYETVADVAMDGPILDINGVEIDPVWAAEFRGFFWGEGSLNMTCETQGRPKSIALAASIGLRCDDAAILEAFQAKLGGNLRSEPYRGVDTRKSISRWQQGIAMHNRRIGRLLESPTGLPFGKAKQLAIWREAVEIKIAAGNGKHRAATRYTSEQRARMHAIWIELKRLRAWDG